MSENNNNNNNIKNDINPENIETIDFDALESTSTLTSTSKAEVDSPSTEETKEDSIENEVLVEENEEIDEISEVLLEERNKKKNLVDLSSLGTLNLSEKKYLQIKDFCIEITPTISYSEIVDGIETCIALILDNRGYISEPIKQIISDIFLLRKFTNLDLYFFETISFSPSYIYEVYGLLENLDIIEKVKNLINQKQLTFWKKSLDSTLNGIIAYRNSALGIINDITERQKDTGNGLEQAMDALKNAENQEAIQNMLKLIGVDNA